MKPSNGEGHAPPAAFQVKFITLQLVALVASLAIAELAVAAKPKLSQPYRNFLNGPPSLLVTRAERQSFQELAADEERDKFIDRFWEVRNPTPGLATNEFKEEFYRRVAYVDSFYGNDAGTDGWRTDRGKTYILFGKPQTTATLLANQELKPTELWFYSNPGLTELPSFFYVLFFDERGSGFHFYHPYVDGPEKLMRDGGRSKSQAYQYLRSVNAEIAHATLSLIPGEPVDTETFAGSMASMQIVDAVQGFNEMPSYTSLISARRARLDMVSTKIEYQLALADLTTFVALEGGKPWVHWRMEVSDPEGKVWAGSPANLSVASKLFSHGQLVVEQSDNPKVDVPAGTSDAAKRPFVYEDMMPVETGTYQLTVALTNKQNGHLYEASKEFEVKAIGERTVVYDVMVVAQHETNGRRRAFTFNAVQFSASPQNAAVASKGLNLLYQIQLPAKRPASLTVHYSVGSAASSFKKSADEKLDLRKTDQYGALLVAKTLPIEEFGPGHYRLSVRIEDSATGVVTALAEPFQIIGERDAPKPIVISKTRNESTQGQAVTQYERALCLLAQDRHSEAVDALKSSWELGKNPAVKTLLDHLPASKTKQ